MTQSFKPAWWLPEGHSQTLWRKFSPSSGVPHHRERAELADGDFIDLDWAAGKDLSRDDAVVVILHGLCGCSSSSYVQSLQTVLSQHDIASVALNFRGCSGEINRLAKAYHSGISEDLQQVLEHLQAHYPSTRFSLVGYSLGANVLLKWLGEAGNHPRVERAVAVSTPFSLGYCSRAMLSGLSRFYGRYFVRSLVATMAQKKAHFREREQEEQITRLEELGDLAGIGSIWEFDDRVTAPLHGFKDAEDYYRRCSSIDFLNSIDKETLLIQSANDPMIPTVALPRSGSLPGHVELRLSHAGGHVGFMAGVGDRWLEGQILDFLRG